MGKYTSFNEVPPNTTFVTYREGVRAVREGVETVLEGTLDLDRK